MKSKSLFFGLFLLLWSFSGWGQQVIDIPGYATTNTYMFDIIRIELTKEATILTGEVQQAPGNWFRISGRTVLRGESGKEYKLLKAESVELNREIYLPESGRMTFDLYFEPLNVGEKKVDYVEGNHESDWLIRGILLDAGPEQEVGEKECVIKGKVLDRPRSHRLVLMGYNDDDRIQESYAIIPVRNGEFAYACDVKDCKVYWLVFADELAKSSFRPVPFFMEPGQVEIVIHPENVKIKPEIRGGELNRSYQQYLQQREMQFHFYVLYAQYDSLDRSKQYYTPRAMELQDLMSQNSDNRSKEDSLYAIYSQLEKENKILTPQVMALNEKGKSLHKEEQKWKEDYMEGHPSLMTYFLLMDDIRELAQNKLHAFPEEAEMLSFKDFPRLENLYHTIYKPMFPDHSYTALIDMMLQSLKYIEIGGTYIDFTAPDFEGKPVTLSEQIKGKVALIDLWASWCGPCRRSAKSMIPVYEKYKSKGFTIVGIAREKDMESAKNAALRDGYPWLNLVEINDSGSIWKKYGVGNSGGGTFLVDREGKILAINPTAEEVENIVKRILE